MKVQEIRDLARTLGLGQTGRMSKLQLIRTIQSAEGNFPCFATALDDCCDQAGCLWRVDCFSTARKTVSAGL
jgi:hypothetical protein